MRIFSPKQHQQQHNGNKKRPSSSPTSFATSSTTLLAVVAVTMLFHTSSSHLAHAFHSIVVPSITSRTTRGPYNFNSLVTGRKSTGNSNHNHILPASYTSSSLFFFHTDSKTHTTKLDVTSSPTEMETSRTDTCLMTKEQLNKYTVKQLKEQIKQLNLPPGHIKTSQLKLKSDIIDFLYEQQRRKIQQHENDEEENGSSSSSSNSSNSSIKNQNSEFTSSPTTTKKKESKTSNTTINTTPQTNNISPRDIIFEHVMKRYPPLRDLYQFTENRNQEEQDNLQHQQQQTTSINPPQFESILSRNPHITKSFSGLGEMDVRQQYHPMLRSMTSSDLDIVTVGTASCIPGVTRGVSCTALRLQWRRNSSTSSSSSSNGGDSGGASAASKNHKNGKEVDNNGMTTGGIWIFDCGESTQLQIQRTGSIRPGKISKIFITHAHGDHSFGLPGLMCIMGQDRDRDGPPLEIYGPEGLRMWIRASIRYSISRIVPPYRVHELMDIPMAPEWTQTRFRNGRYVHSLDTRSRGSKYNGQNQWGTQGLAGEDPTSWISRAPMLNLEPSSQFGEVPGGRDIYPIYNHPKCVDSAPIWEVEDEGDVKVYAAPMSHGVPCVGYVVEEESKPGRLRNDLVQPIAQRNIKALQESGMKIPMKVMAIIKDLPDGGSYTFPDGTTVYQKDVVEPPRKGRKIAICGDTADSRAIAGLAEGADVLVHEATNAFLSGLDKDTSKQAVMKDAQIHGHSTPSHAGKFAKRIGAKRLILNHFSSRYKGDQSLESVSIMTRIEQEAIAASGLEEDKVAAAWDFMVLPVPQNN